MSACRSGGSTHPPPNGSRLCRAPKPTAARTPAASAIWPTRSLATRTPRCPPGRRPALGGGRVMSAIKVTVTEEDIANGEPGEPCRCPIALAVRRAVSGSDPFVSYEEVEFAGDFYPLPSAALQFISLFDHSVSRRHVKPFEFEMQPDVRHERVAGRPHSGPRVHLRHRPAGCPRGTRRGTSRSCSIRKQAGEEAADAPSMAVRDRSHHRHRPAGGGCRAGVVQHTPPPRPRRPSRNAPSATPTTACKRMAALCPRRSTVERTCSASA